jgi:hypothetical protein
MRMMAKLAECEMTAQIMLGLSKSTSPAGGHTPEVARWISLSTPSYGLIECACHAGLTLAE